MDFIPHIDPKQKGIAVRNGAVGMGFDAYTVGQWIELFPPKHAA